MGAVSFAFMKEASDFVSRMVISKFLKGDSETDKWRVNNAVEGFWGFLYFSMIVYWGWFTLRDSRWLPAFIGGRNPNATIEACYENLLYIDTPPGVHCYSLFSFGYHVLAFVNHLRAQKQSDWREVFL